MTDWTAMILMKRSGYVPFVALLAGYLALNLTSSRVSSSTGGERVSSPVMQVPSDDEESERHAETFTESGSVDDDIRRIEQRLGQLSGDSPTAPALHAALPISIAELDRMAALIGNIGPLPDTVPQPIDNPMTTARVDLGRMLFFDKRLSRDNSMSCATCHRPSQGWADGHALAIGFNGRELGRHTPTIVNSAYNTAHFWDGRAATLEEQALGPLLAEGEMNMGSHEDLERRLRDIPEYRVRFSRAFESGPTAANVGKAIAAFERTIVTGQSRFDSYCEGEKGALTDQEKRGLILFMTTASCTACHNGPNFTDNKYHALGIEPSSTGQVDLGRFEVTGQPDDRLGFKTPTLRNIELTAPYMHDGSQATLDEVVAFYNKGGDSEHGRSKLIFPLNLSAAQQQDLVAFLRALTGPTPKISPPQGEHYGE